jgi:hypothetical protein
VATTPVASSLGVTSVTVGGVASVPSVAMIQLRPVGVGSVLLAGSVARTWKVWSPFARPVYALGDAQALKAAPSRLHVKVEPVSLDEKAKLAVLLLTVPDWNFLIVV